MKYIIIILITTLTFLSCKEEESCIKQAENWTERIKEKIVSESEIIHDKITKDTTYGYVRFYNKGR